MLLHATRATAMRLSNEERRALGIILGLLVISAAARWMERPRPLLDDVPALDVAAVEEESRAAHPASARGTASGGGGARPAAQALVDPNSATALELQRLPGVGPAMAQRILEERERGVFASSADLQRVRGIGPALAAKLAEHVTLPAAEQPAPSALVPRVGATNGTVTSTGAGLGGAPGGGAPGVAPAPAQPLDLNRAGSAELQRVPGIGPALAGRLIARRDSLGAFRDWSQVDAVSGIGPAMLARLMAMARLAP
jgi:competence protein ComEA